jgi:hypothetical protein
VWNSKRLGEHIIWSQAVRERERERERWIERVATLHTVNVCRRGCMTSNLALDEFSWMWSRRRDTRPNDTHHNGTRPSGTQHNDIARHWILNVIEIMLSVAFFMLELSVSLPSDVTQSVSLSSDVMLNVVAPWSHLKRSFRIARVTFEREDTCKLKFCRTGPLLMEIQLALRPLNGATTLTLTALGITTLYTRIKSDTRYKRQSAWSSVVNAECRGSLWTVLILIISVEKQKKEKEKTGAAYFHQLSVSSICIFINL